MIRFGVIVTVVMAAVGLLVVGAVAGDLTLVYVSIALAAVALLLLIVGVAVWRDEVFASSARRDERDLAAVGAVGQASRVTAGPGALEGWPDRPSPTPRPGAMPGLGLQGGDTREFAVPAGALPDRDAPGERDRRSGEPRPTEQPPRPAGPAGRRPGREVRHRERTDREAAAEDWPGRDGPAPDRTGREAAAAGWPGRDLAAEDWPGRDAAPERSAREAAAADRAARETLAARRPDRVERYQTLGPERYESADDPTRLAHRLDSLADLGRSADPDATSSTRSRAGRPGGQRPSASAPIDPLTGPAGEWRSAAEPLAAAPSTGRAAARPTGIEQGAGADADAPQPSRAVTATPEPATTATNTTAPTMASESGSRGPVLPADAGHGRPDSGRDRSESAAADSPGGSLAWPHVSPGADARLPAEAASAAAADLAFPVSPARVPAGDEDPATAARSAAARLAQSAAATAPAAAVGTAAASEPGASAGTSPVGSPAAASARTDGGAATEPAIGLDDQVSVVPGIARYHKADCILIRFLSDDDLEVMSRRSAEAADCAPCRACRPDRPSASD
jgi:hypothetical protein